MGLRHPNRSGSRNEQVLAVPDSGVRIMLEPWLINIAHLSTVGSKNNIPRYQYMQIYGELAFVFVNIM